MRSPGAGVSLLLLLGLPAQAQVVLDGSLGPGGSIPLAGGEYAITDALGRYSANGASLFFSFGDFGGILEPGQSGFDVGVGETAHFSASLGAPERVVARVTSGVTSNIQGLLRSSIQGPLGGADVFLLNSSGILIGNGAQLDVQGSFYASTADVLRFEDGDDLIVADSSPGPLLSTAAPAAFGFTSESPALISVARTRALSVPAGETLSFVGGDDPASPGAGVVVTGEDDIGAPDVIAAPGASLEIAAAAGPLDIPVDLGDFDVGAADPASLGGVEISTFAKVRLSGVGETPSGQLVIRGGRFTLASNAQILARNDSDTAPALGPLDIAVSGDLVLEGANSQIQSWTSGEAAAGDVLLSGDRVLLRNGADLILFNGGAASHGGQGPDGRLSGRVIGLDTNAQLLVRSLSSGPASHVQLVADEAIDLDNGADVISEVLAGSSTTGGVIALDAPSVRISGAGQVSTFNAGTQAGTAIEIHADTLGVDDGGGIVSLTRASGAGGLIHLDVGSLAVTDGGRIGSDTTGGPGGAIEVFADSVRVSNATERAEGTLIEARNGGSIAIEARLVELEHGGQIFTRTDAAAAAGPLEIRNADLVSASGVDAQARPAGLFSRTGPAATGAGGLLSVQTQVLEVRDGAELSSASLGAGDAGAMVLKADRRVSVSGGPSGFSLVSASAAPGASGNGSALTIQTDLLELRDGGQVTTSTSGPGAAGSVTAHARNIEISGVDPATGANSAGFFSRSAGLGNGGAVTLHASDSIWMADNALISASSSDRGLAGDIALDAGNTVQLNGSLITTEADLSAGGNVRITAGALVYLFGSAIQTLVKTGAGGGGDVAIDPVHTVLNHSRVVASAVGGPGGNISITTGYYFQSGDSFLDASSAENVDGVIDVVSPTTELVGSLVPLPATYLDASSQLERDCAARTSRAGSFVVRSRKARLTPPDAALHVSDLDPCAPQGSTP